MKGGTAGALFFALLGILLIAVGFLVNTVNPPSQGASNATYESLVLPLYVIGAISIIIALIVLWLSRSHNPQPPVV